MSGHVTTSQGSQIHIGPQRVNANFVFVSVASLGFEV